MLDKNESSSSHPLKVGIVGAGFSGTALLAAIHRLAIHPIEIHLFDKTGLFAAGQAYKTPFSFHLLNARAKDMSAYDDMPTHFADWLMQYHVDALRSHQPIAEQFVPRLLYHQYLRSILDDICQDKKGNVTVITHADEVVDLQDKGDKTYLITHDGQQIGVDKVVLAIGVEPHGRFPFPVAEHTQCVANPWQYEAVAAIPSDESILIVGSGLSMVDTVLTLHHKKHRGSVVAVSRHGMLPLPHADLQHVQPLEIENIPVDLRTLFREMRELNKKHVDAGGDWRSIFNMLRQKLPGVWRESNLTDKKRFLRHVLPYWNIHRHRLHNEIFALLTELQQTNWLTIYAGRVMGVANDNATIKLRHSGKKIDIAAKWLINCMGFSLHDGIKTQPLLGSLVRQHKAIFDPLRLGFDVTPEGMLKTENAKQANPLYAIGPPTQGEAWETVGAPEIRKQCMILARILLKE